MAEISPDKSILSMLKTWYKDGVENLMFRNSPVVKKINKIRVEGKEQRMNAMYGRGGACSASFTVAKNNAANSGRDVEFVVKPGQLFSVYTVNTKEILASKSRKGAYMRISGMKMFAASEAFRKNMAAAFYGSGYGEIAVLPTDTPTSITTVGDVVLKLPADAIMKIDVGTWLDFKDTISGAVVKGTATVMEINGNDVKVKSNSGTITVKAGDAVCISGSVDSAGNPLLPIGLGGWLPTVANRTTGTWTSYIEAPFMGVNRSVCADRLAGSFILGGKNEKISDTLQKLIVKCRRQGSQADMIVLNDDDFLKMSKEIEATNTFFTQTSTKEAKKASFGISDFSASFSTNFIENIIDDPYCPAGKCYVLDSNAVELWSYTNTDVMNDNVEGNNPGKPDPMASDSEGEENTNYNLMISDYLSVQPGEGNDDGPSTQVSLMFYGTFTVTNPSVCGVAVFDNNTKYIGYGK